MTPTQRASSLQQLPCMLSMILSDGELPQTADQMMSSTSLAMKMPLTQKISLEHYSGVAEVKKTLQGMTTQTMHVGHAPLFKCPGFIPSVLDLV